MNKRFAVILTIILMVLALALVWRKTYSRAITRSLNPTNISNEPTPQASTQKTADDRQLPGGPYVSSDPRWKTVRERDKNDPNWEWRMPINFYGRILDENEKPISGALVYAQWSDLSAAGASSEETLSDAEGLFSITGKIGRGITIRIAKDGYHTPKQKHGSFDYAGFWEANYYEPDPAHPVTFHLRKKGAGETLSAGVVQLPIAADGVPVRLDLLNSGRVSPAGQLEIAAITNTEKYPPHTFDWRASIAVPDGGLKEHNLEFPFEAPDEGYQSTVEFHMPASSPDWKRSIEKDYFVRFGSPPRYGRIHIRFNGATQRAWLRFAVNPTGSRRLEGTDEQF